MKLSYNKLKRFAYVYTSIPLIIFAIGWLRPLWAVIMTIATIVCLFLALFNKKDDQTEEKEYITVSPMFIGIALFVALIWVWQSGIGGMWAQSRDFPFRNAIFRDLIYRDWPVVYDKLGGVLDYYVGYWLFPALFGKIAIGFGADVETAFTIGNIVLYFWTVFGIVLLFLLIAVLVKCNTKKKFVLAILMFVFFSGMDILGSLKPLGMTYYHIEWWARDYQYSSFTTCLFWVFNQSIIPWIIMICLLNEKTVKNFVFLGMMCLFSGPLPFLGLFTYCVVIGIKLSVELCLKKEHFTVFRRIFSISNILASICIFPVIGSYLTSNDALNGGNIRVSQDAVSVSEQSESLWGQPSYLLFILFEFGAFALLMMNKYCKNYLFYLTIAELMVLPFIQVGAQHDFPMRVSIPALVMMYVMCVKYIIEEKEITKVLPEEKVALLPDIENRKEFDKKKVQRKNRRLLYYTLVVCLIIGAVTPMVEFYRGIRQVSMRGIVDPISDSIVTLGGDGPYFVYDDAGAIKNFICTQTDEQKYFIYFSKELD